MLFVDVGIKALGREGIMYSVLSPISKFLCYAAWLGVTISVLLLMESLSAFLYALHFCGLSFKQSSTMVMDAPSLRFLTSASYLVKLKTTIDPKRQPHHNKHNLYHSQLFVDSIMLGLLIQRA